MEGKTKVKVSDNHWQEGDPEGVGYVEQFFSQTTREMLGTDRDTGKRTVYHEYMLMAVCVFGKQIVTIDSALLEVVGNELK